MICDFIKKRTINEKLYYGRTPMIQLDLNFPSMTGQSPSAVRFNLYYRQMALKQYNYARIKLYPQAVKQYQFSMAQGYPFNTYEMVQNFDVTYCKKPVVSLYFDLYEFTGGAHGNTVRTGNTWDLKRGTLLMLKDLFVKDFDYNRIILKSIEAEAHRRQVSGKADYFENLSENLVKFYDEKNFFLTDEGIAIFYPLYTIAPYVTGIQVFVVPYVLFGSNMTIPL